jgi:putative PIN family toxin of toxin-antitoxin system
MVVIDANVLVRALRSQTNASHEILRRMLLGELEFAVSSAVALEYESVLHRPGVLGPRTPLSSAEIDQVLDAIFAAAAETMVWFKLRPVLDDPKDEIYVECAFASGANVIVTDDRHFRHPGLRAFGIRALRAQEFLAGLQKDSSP